MPKWKIWTTALIALAIIQSIKITAGYPGHSSSFERGVILTLALLAALVVLWWWRPILKFPAAIWRAVKAGRAGLAAYWRWANTPDERPAAATEEPQAEWSMDDRPARPR